MGPYQKLGCIGKRARRPTEDTLQGKQFTEENTSWQPRKRLRRRKRNTNRPARRYSQEPKGFLQKASKEKHLPGGFLILSSDATSSGTAFCFTFCSTFIPSSIHSKKLVPSRRMMTAAPIPRGSTTDYPPLARIGVVPRLASC